MSCILSCYVSPNIYDLICPQVFLSRVNELSDKLTGPEYRSLDGIDGEELNTMVQEVSRLTVFTLREESV